MRKFHFGAIGVGLGLLIFLIWNIGVDALVRDLVLLGWHFIPFVLIEGAAKVLHTVGWRYCLTGPYRNLPFYKVLGIDLAGHSINYFTPTATIGGEVVRGSLLYSLHKSPEAISSVIVGKVTFVLSQITLCSLGAMFFVSRIPLSTAGYLGVLAINLLILGGVVGFLLVQKYGKLGSMMRWLAAHNIGGAVLRKGADQITNVDQQLRSFYRSHPDRFLLSMLWHCAAMFVSILRVWYFLWVLSGGSLFMAAGIWFLSTWLDILTFPIPLEIGLQETIRVLVFSTLQYTMALGLTFGIALRLEQIIWGGMGMLSYALLFPRGRKEITTEKMLKENNT